MRKESHLLRGVFAAVLLLPLSGCSAIGEDSRQTEESVRDRNTLEELSLQDACDGWWDSYYAAIEIYARDLWDTQNVDVTDTVSYQLALGDMVMYLSDAALRVENTELAENFVELGQATLDMQSRITADPSSHGDAANYFNPAMEKVEDKCLDLGWEK
jgi:hypothetical protein